MVHFMKPILIAFFALLCTVRGSAQTYAVDTKHGDSLAVNEPAVVNIESLFALFGAIYIVGAMVAVVGLSIAAWKLFVQMPIAVLPWAWLSMIVFGTRERKFSKIIIGKGRITFLEEQ